METKSNIFYKGILLFSGITFLVYLLLSLLAFGMSAFGLSCNCYAWTSLGIFAAAMIYFVLCWYRSCHKM